VGPRLDYGFVKEFDNLLGVDAHVRNGLQTCGDCEQLRYCQGSQGRLSIRYYSCCRSYGIDVKMIAIYTQLSQTGALRSALGLADWSLYWLSVADD